MSPAEVGLLSLLLFAGSAQFIFAELITVAPITLVVTIFLVNFRHFLYSSAFAYRVRNLSVTKRICIGAQLTDETFAVASSVTSEPLQRARGMLALNIFSYTCWFIGTLTGALVGGVGGDYLELIGIDFALASMFAALLMLQVYAVARKRPIMVVAGLSAIIMVTLQQVHEHPLNLLIAIGVAAALGVWWFGQPGLVTAAPRASTEQQI